LRCESESHLAAESPRFIQFMKSVNSLVFEFIEISPNPIWARSWLRTLMSLTLSLFLCFWIPRSLHARVKYLSTLEFIFRNGDILSWPNQIHFWGIWQRMHHVAWIGQFRWRVSSSSFLPGLNLLHFEFNFFIPHYHSPIRATVFW
jgi:hypothetical protein